MSDSDPYHFLPLKRLVVQLYLLSAFRSHCFLDDLIDGAGVGGGFGCSASDDIQRDVHRLVYVLLFLPELPE